ncbi:hypothetical protein B296_00016010 [Ensete ventricosum]|uniref:Uncharacterized protein n=1 Tax=Ensete ventricosum TaxID=4639 RepID=A0A427AG04_ENSVE|nr:hypothetical protein B296_00016010 [Ensete ventricosum]
MGLLLIEKKEWIAKYDKLRQEMSEAAQLQKRMQAAHIVAVAEFEKREGNLRRAMGFQRQSIVHSIGLIKFIFYFVIQLEKALNDMHAEIAEVKLDSEKKLSEAHNLEATIEEECLEIKEKQHSLDARLAKVSRKSSEVDRRLEDVEARKQHLRRIFLNKERTCGLGNRSCRTIRRSLPSGRALKTRERWRHMRETTPLGRKNKNLRRHGKPWRSPMN